MKETIEQKMEKEIALKKKLPKEIEDAMNKKVFYNLIIGCIIIVYFIFLNMGFTNIDKNIFIKDTQVFSVTVLVISIILFEKSYKKENGSIAIFGIETLIVALTTLFIPYLYYYAGPLVSKILRMEAIFIAIYYVAKGTIICAMTQTKYEENISDVKEIVKRERKSNDEIIEMDKDKEAEEIKIDEKIVPKKISKKTGTKKTTPNSKKKDVETKEDKKETKKKTASTEKTKKESKTKSKTKTPNKSKKE